MILGLVWGNLQVILMIRPQLINLSSGDQYAESRDRLKSRKQQKRHWKTSQVCVKNKEGNRKIIRRMWKMKLICFLGIKYLRKNCVFSNLILKNRLKKCPKVRIANINDNLILYFKYNKYFEYNKKYNTTYQKLQNIKTIKIFKKFI